MRYLYKIVMTLCLLSIYGPIGQLECASDNNTAENRSTVKYEETPDPLDLSNNWWNYFNVPPEKLPERVDLFKNKIEILKKSLKEDEHLSIIQAIDRVLFNFDMLIRKKQTPFQDQSTGLQFLKSYSIDQMLKVNKRYQNTINKLAHEKESLETEKNNLAKIKNKLDDFLLQYPGVSNASFKKLDIGLSIISTRTEQAIAETTISNTGKRIEAFDLEKKRLEQELSFARLHMNFNDESETDLNAELAAKEQKIEEEQSNLQTLQKRAFYEETKNDNELNCCLWDNKILNQSVITQTAKIRYLIAQIKYRLYFFVNNPKDYPVSRLRNLVAEFQEQINEGKNNIRQWEQVLQNEQTRIGKQVELSLQSKKAPVDNSLLMNIHLEIDQVILYIQELKFLIQNAELLVKQMEWYLIKDKSIHETWWILLQRNVQNAYETFTAATGYALFRVQNKPVTILDILQAAAIVVASFFLSKVFKRVIFDKRYMAKKLSPSTQYIIVRCFHYIFMIIGTFVALSFIGLDFTNFLIFAGALGVGIGFGMQSLVNNIFSGLLLLLQRNIKVGDVVELSDKLIGRVQEITLQNTHIHSFEGLDLIVPNFQLTSQLLNNWTLHDSCRRYRIPFHVGIDEDKDKVKKIVLEIAGKVPSVKKDEFGYANPQLWLMGFSDFGMDFELFVWVDLDIALPTGVVQATLLWNLHTALKENGITITYPQRHIRYDDKPDNSEEQA